MLTKGFNLDGRSPGVCRKAWHPLEAWVLSEDGATPLGFWGFAAMTCMEAWYDAKDEDGDNPMIRITETTGFTSMILLEDFCFFTPDVERWCVLEQNEWQFGSGYNIQQYWSDNIGYNNSWQKEIDAVNPKRIWGTGDMSHDRKCWKFLSDNFERLRVADITEFLHTRTWINQTQASGVFESMKKLASLRLDHSHHAFNHARFMRIAYALESATRTCLDKTTTLRRHALVVEIFTQFAMPLVQESRSEFLLHRDGDASRIAQLLTMKVAFKTKPVAALIVDLSSASAKKKKGKRVQAAAPGGDCKPEANAQLIKDPEIEVLPFVTVISRCLDEGLWQLLHNKVDVDQEGAAHSRILDMIAIGARIFLGGQFGPGVRVGEGEAAKVLHNAEDWRAYVFEALNTFSRGWVLVHDLPLAPEPVPALENVKSIGASVESQSSSQACAAADVPAAATSSDKGTDLEVLGYSESLKLQKWVLDHDFDCATTRLELIEMQNYIVNLMTEHRRSHPAQEMQWNDLLEAIIMRVDKEVNYLWVNEVRLMREKDKPHTLFFHNPKDVDKFLQVRTNYIVSLWLDYGLQHISLSLGDVRAKALVAAADSLIANKAELVPFWSSVVQWFGLRAKEQLDMVALSQFLGDLNSSMGLTYEDVYEPATAEPEQLLQADAMDSMDSPQVAGAAVQEVVDTSAIVNMDKSAVMEPVPSNQSETVTPDEVSDAKDKKWTATTIIHVKKRLQQVVASLL